jgi:hypothetical protein
MKILITILSYLCAKYASVLEKRWHLNQISSRPEFLRDPQRALCVEPKSSLCRAESLFVSSRKPLPGGDPYLEYEKCYKCPVHPIRSKIAQ